MGVASPPGDKIGQDKLALGSTKTKELNPSRAPTDEEFSSLTILRPNRSQWALIAAPIKSNSVVPKPGKYIVEARFGDESYSIGETHFVYQKRPPFSVEEITAIKSNPYSDKVVALELGCKHCSSKFRVYAGLESNSKFEQDGYRWYSSIGEHEFICSCKKTALPLKYVKENLHALLGRDNRLTGGALSYVRRYAHSELMLLIREFVRLLDKGLKEEVYQEFIETHTVLFARFHANKIFSKPSILGKFQPDFAIVDSEQKLLLIELERPSLRLFKNNGHPTSDFMHAYEQVRDWLHEYEKHHFAVLEGLGLKPDQISATRGVVIAGRNKSIRQEHMQRHRSDPIYSGIEFLTFDDLPSSLREISTQIS